MSKQASWGAGLYRCSHRGWCSQRRPWRGAALGPAGPAQPKEALSGVALGLPGLLRPEEALVEVGLRARTREVHGGLVGGSTQVHQDLHGWRVPWEGGA